MTGPRVIDPEQQDVLRQAEEILADFDARHGPMLTAVLAAVEEFLSIVRAAVMGLGGRPDLDQFPHPHEWLAVMHAKVDDQIRQAYTEAYLSVYDRADERDADSADIFNVAPFVQHHIETVSDRLRDWPQGVFEEIRDELHESVRADESVEQLRDRIGAVLGIDAPSRDIRHRIHRLGERIDKATDRAEQKALRAERSALYSNLKAEDYAWQWRAERIARTEVTAAVNGGTYQAHVTQAAATGRRLRKQWLATSDGNVRPSHAWANGQVRPFTEPFRVGHADLAFPADPAGPAGETINCRCTMLVLHEDMDPLDLGPIGDLEELTAAAPEAAVTAPVMENMPADIPGAPLPDGWRGPLAPLDVPSGDGRIIADPGDQLQVRPLPLPLLAQEALQEGHNGAIVVGLIERAWIQDGQLWAEGPLDLADEGAQRWARRLADGYAGGVSVDLDAVTMTEMMLNTATGQVLDIPQMDDVAAGDPEMAGLMEALAPSAIPDGHELVYRALPWRLMSATLVSQPAFHEARVSPLWGYTGADTGQTTPPDRQGAQGDAMSNAVAWNGPPPPRAYAFPPPKGGGGDSKPPATPGDEPTWMPKVGDRVIVDDPEAGGPGEVTAIDTTTDPVMVTVQLDAGGPVEVEVDKVSPEEPAEDTPKAKAPNVSQASALRALRAGGPVAPPAEVFADPGLSEPTPLTVEGDRVFGHLALWDTCHVGIPGVCTTPPRTNTGYALFHTGEVACSGGELLPVGKITLGTGHADPEVGFRAAAEHYDHTGAVVAIVRAYEDAHGIAVAGVLCPEADDKVIAQLRRSPLSGDWRRVGGNLELVAALAVNVPGFPVSRPSLAASVGDGGRQVSLVAAGSMAPRASKAISALSAAISQALDERDRNTRRLEAARVRINTPAAVWPRTRVAIAAARINGDSELVTKVATAHGFKGDQ